MDQQTSAMSISPGMGDEAVMRQSSLNSHRRIQYSARVESSYYLRGHPWSILGSTRTSEERWACPRDELYIHGMVCCDLWERSFSQKNP